MTDKLAEQVQALVEALREARGALHFHYVEWDGEPEDAVPLQLARSKCDAALSSIDLPAIIAELGRPREQYAWLIEHGASEPCAPRYWGGVHSWTYNHQKACRFAREIDAQSQAEAMDDGFPDNYRIAEHAWIEPLPTPPTESKEP